MSAEAGDQGVLRVLHITGRSDHGGGPEHLLQVLLASRSATRAWVACPREGVYWARFAAVVGEDRLLAIPHRALRWSSLAAIQRSVQEQGIQVIHSHGLSAGIYGRLAAWRAGVPSVHTFHGIPAAGSLKAWMVHRLEAVLRRWTATAIAVSASEAAALRDAHPAYGERLVTIPNGIAARDPGLPPEVPGARAPAEPPARCPAGRCSVLSFTRDCRQKNPQLVIAIAQHLRARGELGDLRFDLYGEGIAQRPFRRQVAAAGLSARIRCHPATDDPRAAMAAAWCYLSTARWEGMPLALLEAARAGRAIVASAVIGNRDLVANGRDGLLFADGDAAGAAACLVALRSDPTAQRQMEQAAAQRFLAHHTSDVMARAIIQVYIRAIQPDRPPSRAAAGTGPATSAVPASTSAPAPGRSC